MFQKVALSQGPVRMILALERRAVRLGDTQGALLLAMLLSPSSEKPKLLKEIFKRNIFN